MNHCNFGNVFMTLSQRIAAAIFRLQRIVFKSQLFGRAIDSCKKVSHEVLLSDDGAMAIARAIHICDSLSAITNSYKKFLSTLQATTFPSESSKSFERMLDALLCTHSSSAREASLPEFLVASSLISSATLADKQRLSILSGAAPKPHNTASNKTTELLKKVSYEEAALIMRSFDRP